jgi:hypothetical protein
VRSRVLPLTWYSLAAAPIRASPTCGKDAAEMLRGPARCRPAYARSRRPPGVAAGEAAGPEPVTEDAIFIGGCRWRGIRCSMCITTAHEWRSTPGRPARDCLPAITGFEGRQEVPTRARVAGQSAHSHSEGGGHGCHHRSRTLVGARSHERCQLKPSHHPPLRCLATTSEHRTRSSRTRFFLTPPRTARGLGPKAFFGWRYLADGSPNPFVEQAGRMARRSSWLTTTLPAVPPL